MREPLLLPLAAIAIGICTAQFVQFSLHEAVIDTAILALVAIAAFFTTRPWLYRTVTLLALFVGGITLDAAHRPGPPPQIDATSQEVVILSGCVVEPPILTEDREHFVLELAPGARARVALAVRPDERAPDLRYGQRIEIDAKVRRPHNFANPGAFDYVRYLARQNVYWTATARAGSPVTTLPGTCGSPVMRFVFALRTAGLERIERLYAGNAYATAMMDAILIGESTNLQKVWTDHFRRTGTFHALVISGLHVTVLAGVLLFLLRLCLLNEMTSLCIAAVGAWVYAGVSGWSAPVVRAAGGFTLYLVCRYFFRRGRVLNLLAAIGIAYLIYDPGQLFDASFQLSFFSVAAIGALAVPILDSTSAVYRSVPLDLASPSRDLRMPAPAAAFRIELRLLAETIAFWTPIRQTHTLKLFAFCTRLALWLFEMVVISAVVQVALALPMALYFHRISLTGLSANLLIVPLLSAVVPIGFAAIFTGLAPLAWIAHLLLRWSEAVAAWHVGFEPSTRLPDPPLWLAVALILALVAAAIALRARSVLRWPSLASVLALFALVIINPFGPDAVRGKLELTVIDVGQGDSLFVSLPDGRTMLVDAGGIPGFGRRTKPRIDIGEDVVSPYLWRRGIRRLDVVAITHAHEDHIGGLESILDNFRPAELWTGAVPSTARWNSIQQQAARLGIRIVRRHAGERIGDISVIAPLPDYEPDATPKNNDSLGMRLKFGEHSFLLMGDIEKQIEYQLAADNALSRTTVLKVGHHGSKTSSTEEFLNAVQPTFALISAGFENSFGHPHPAVMARLAEHHTSALRTDLDGLITIITDGHHLSVNHGSNDPARFGFDPNLPPR